MKSVIWSSKREDLDNIANNLLVSKLLSWIYPWKYIYKKCAMIFVGIQLKFISTNVSTLQCDKWVMQCFQLVLSRSCYMINQVKLKALTHWSIVWCGRNKINYLGVHKERGGGGAQYIKRVQHRCYCCNTHIAPFLLIVCNPPFCSPKQCTPNNNPWKNNQGLKHDYCILYS